MKKITCFVLVIAMLFAFNNSTVFASENPEIVVHTISYKVEPGNSIQPLMYDEDEGNVGAGVIGVNVPESFLVPERYFAFETKATNEAGQAIDGGSHRVDLIISDVSIAYLTAAVDGEYHKLDWIDLGSTNNTCHFRLTNFTNVPINIYLKYYSWS